jgi:hypothetical protein
MGILCPQLRNVGSTGISIYILVGSTGIKFLDSQMQTEDVLNIYFTILDQSVIFSCMQLQ